MRNLIFILMAILLCFSTYNLFVILLTMFGVISAIEFSAMFLLYYIYRNVRANTERKLINNIYAVSRVTVFALIIYPAYIEYNFSGEFILYVICIILIELILEVSKFKDDDRS